ncbi:MAG: Putative glycosyltransferase, family 2 [Leptospirillum sp. Group II 'C75']|jgi:glycosyltransferase involved in cell wall biosynthesis|uniref:glycosyltransferase family A protein n=1 Tax=Leptospirillum sp. Group II 'CF-1' TaxID=1660083 RepID=UPI0000F0CF49|nr:glycosyltransferase family A protein [Leptospirillum sp. Group II 'CF-1']EAY56218.1 MAG: putative glycosyltransferase, family 2 [Leptospirillum rubarum]EIJ75431.1 MAG: Putative glycosyltransferase, family 2 [Leptospirillum sp. Group II 'C75']
MKYIVSVIITIYKHKKKLSDAIESVLAQTFNNIEIILVDNNALVDTVLLAKQYQEKYPSIIRIVHEPKQGIASARNRGIIEAVGEYITFCDEDDIWLQDKLLKQINAQQKHPESSIITCLVNFISYKDGALVESDQCFSPQFWASELYGKTEKYKKYPLYNPHPSTMFFRKELAKEVGLFDEAFNPYWTEDTEFSLRMYDKGPIYLVQESLVNIRISSSEYLISRQGEFDFVSIKNLDYFFKKLCCRFLNDCDNKVTHSLRRIRAQWMREISIKFLGFDNGKKFARILLMRAIKDQPLNWKTWKTYLRTFFPKRYYPYFFKISKITNQIIPAEIDDKFCRNLFLGFFDK